MPIQSHPRHGLFKYRHFEAEIILDKEGNLIDSMLSKHRDMEAARSFFSRAKDVVGL